MRIIATALALLFVLPASGQDRQDQPTIQLCGKTSRASLVGLEIHLRKKTKLERVEADTEESSSSQEEEMLDGLAENQQTLDTYAVVVDAAGTLLMAYQGLKASAVEKIVGTAPDGTTFTATLEAVNRHYDCFVLKASKPPGGSVAAAFEAFEPFPLGSNYYLTAMERVDGRWHLNVSPYIVTNAPLVETGKGWYLIDRMRQGGLLFDAKGRLVGIPFDSYLWKTEGGRDSFIGKNIVPDERIPLADLRKNIEKLQADLTANAIGIEFMLRDEKPQDRYGEREMSAKTVLYGLPIDEQGTVLIPRAQANSWIRKVESVRAMLKEGPRAATFLGRFKSWDGMLVRVDGLKTQAMPQSTVKALEPGLLYFTVAVEDKFGRAFASAEPNRIFRVNKGLKGSFKDELRSDAKAGSLLCDGSGAVIGIHSAEKPEEDVEEAAESETESWRRNYRRRGGNYLNKLYLFSELAATLAKPEGHFDPKAVPVSKKEEKTLVWLGFEFHEIGKPLAELLGVGDKEMTNDGKRGLLITDVYLDSPATKVGLKADDIVLTVKPLADGGKTIDLTPEQERYSRYRDGGTSPWRARRNYLTIMLTQIGAGKEIAIEYLRGKEKKTATLKLEDGPPDFDTAERHKDEALGLTVKSLTYEVRYYHKLEAGATGVVVAKVESGSKAEIGKVSMMSIITRVNDQPVKDLAHFIEMLKALQKTTAKSVTLTAFMYGQTRLSDVELVRD